MYKIVYRPFSAVEQLKKHATRDFVVMLLVSSMLMAALIAGLWSANSQWIEGMQSSGFSLGIPGVFILAFVGMTAIHFARAFLLHIVMRIFTDKGNYEDALRVVAVSTFLASVYGLGIAALSLIPVTGVGLAIIAVMLAVLIVASVTIRGIAVSYKTDIITACVALVIIAVATMAAMHLCFLFSADGSPARWGMGWQRPGMMEGFRYKAY